MNPKDTFSIEWKLKIEDKLSMNADHFPTDPNKAAYIYLRTGGGAAQPLNPYRINHSKYFNTLEQIIAILSSIYDDSNHKENARHEFKKLKKLRMSLEVKFHMLYKTNAITSSRTDPEFPNRALPLLGNRH